MRPIPPVHTPGLSSAAGLAVRAGPAWAPVGLPSRLCSIDDVLAALREWWRVLPAKGGGGSLYAFS